MKDWSYALDQKTDLYRLYETVAGIGHCAGFLESVRRKTGEELFSSGKVLADVQRFMLAQAEPIFVHPEVMDVLEVAAPGFKPESLLATDIFCPAGFCLLPRPLYVDDIHHKRMSYRALAWMPCMQRGEDRVKLGKLPGEGRPGIFFALYSSDDDGDDYTEQERQIVRHAGYHSKWTLAHFGPLWFDDDSVLEHWSNVSFMQGFQALMRLAQQRILVRSYARPDRAAARRAARLNIVNTTLVITLRRQRNLRIGDEEPEPANYSHRFVVGGHWRWQFYPSENVHRQIYINDFIKGPEDKPLVVKQRAWDFRR